MKNTVNDLIEAHPISERTADAARRILAAAVFDLLEEDCGAPISRADFISTIDALGHDVAIAGALEYHRRAIESDLWELPSKAVN